MRISESPSSRRPLALALLLPLLAACGGDKDSTGPDETVDGPVGEALDILGDLAAEFVVGNEPVFNSLAFFIPQIAGALGAAPTAPVEIGRASLSAQCFAQQLLGVTFDYNFGQNAYTASGLTGAPATGIRFVLFEIAGGAPNQGSQLGHVDIICNASLPNFDMSVVVAVNGANALSLNALGAVDPGSGAYSVNVAGYIGADGGKKLPFGESGVSNVNGRLGGPADFFFDYSVLPAQDISAEFSRFELPGTFLAMAAVRQQSDSPWGLNAELSGSSRSSIAGALRFDTPGQYNPQTNEVEDGGTLYVACFSGTYENPAVGPGSGCNGGDGQSIGLSQAELAGVKAGYDGLRRLSDSLGELISGGMNVLASQLDSQ